MKSFFSVLEYFLLKNFRSFKYYVVIVLLICTLLLFLSISGTLENSANTYSNSMKNVNSGAPQLLEIVNEYFGDIRLFVPYVVSLFLIPLISLIVSYNSFSKQISNGGFRYWATRVTRSKIYLARLFSELFMILFSVAISFFAIFIYLIIQNKILIRSYAVILGPFLLILFYGFAFTALFVFISSLSKNSHVALLFSLIAFALMFVFLFIGVRYLSIFNYIGFQSFAHYSDVLLNILFLTIYSTIISVAGIFLFKRRDL